VLKVGVDMSATVDPEAGTKREENGLAKIEGNSEMSATDKEALFEKEKGWMEEYVRNNYPCDTSDCNTGNNHCCSMCKLVKGVKGTSKLEDNMSERLAEAVLGNLFGGCVLKYDENKETALHKVLEWHKKYPPTEGDNRNMNISFDIPHSPCQREGSNGMYQGFLMRMTLFEVRQEHPTLADIDVPAQLVMTLSEILKRDDYRLIKETFGSADSGSTYSLAEFDELLPCPNELVPCLPGSFGDDCRAVKLACETQKARNAQINADRKKAKKC
jgi:hypothetical protein